MKSGDDKRRGPYNLWVYTVGVLIILLFLGAGMGVAWVGHTAHSYPYTHELHPRYGPPYTETKLLTGTPVKDNLQLTITKIVWYTLSAGILLIGIGVGSDYIEGRRWLLGDRFPKTKRR